MPGLLVRVAGWVGCRGIELAYQRVPGVVDTLVGYTQGKVDKPTYEAVCYADTGHTEGIQVRESGRFTGRQESGGLGRRARCCAMASWWLASSHAAVGCACA